jgi:VanZ family protein
MTKAGTFFFSRRLSFALAVLWTLGIFILLSLPGSSLPQSSLLAFDKLGHAGLFFVLALVWLNAFSADSGRIISLVLIIGILLGFFSEWYQSMAPIGRSADIFDSIADTIGFGLGTIAWVILLRVKKPAS